MMFQDSFVELFRLLQVNFKGKCVSRKFKDLFLGFFSRMVQGLLKEVARVFQECYN